MFLSIATEIVVRKGSKPPRLIVFIHCMGTSRSIVAASPVAIATIALKRNTKVRDQSRPLVGVWIKNKIAPFMRTCPHE
jgi:hypothetical protein